VSLFARPLPKRPDRRSQVVGRSLLALLIATVAAFVLAAPAGAVVTAVPAGPTVGLQPRNGTSRLSGTPTGEFQNVGGHAVVHGSEVFVVYWDPGDVNNEAWQRIIDKFNQSVGAESGSLSTIFTLLEQYGDNSGAIPRYHVVFRGAYTDTNKYPAVAGCTNPGLPALGAISCLTDAQVREQLQTFIGQHSLPKGMHSIFLMVTPPGVTVCADAAATHCSDYEGTPLEESYAHSFCSYHAAINPGGLPMGDGNTILYAVLPWIASGFATQSYDCQDGGFDPSSKPAEKREKAKEVSKKESEEFAEKTAEEKAKIERTRELEGPHVQEPNQPAGNGEDLVSNGGLADLIVNQAAVELANIDTDPLLNSWQDEAGKEVTDVCRNTFDSTGTSAGGTFAGREGLSGSVTADEETGAGSLANQTYNGSHYYLNNVYNLSATLLGHAPLCPAGTALDPHFTAPNPVNTGEVVGFDGMESQIWMAAGIVYSPVGVPSPTYATYTWNFGDGTPTVSGYAPGAPVCSAPWLSPCAASEFHSYQYGGTYTVTLTVTDVGGNTTSYSQPLTVVGPPPPSAGSGAGPGAGAGSAGAGAGSSGAGTTSSPSGSPSAAAPIATAAVVSRSLRNLPHTANVVVRYSVNEQVAGHFEVLLPTATARRLGISGSPATGLPLGSPPELVIARAVLVTTRGGTNTFKILLSKHTAQRLAKLHKVSMLLRLVVRNASRTPLSSTVISSFTLSR
jgi:hypothetical protein